MKAHDNKHPDKSDLTTDSYFISESGITSGLGHINIQSNSERQTDKMG